MNIYFFLNKTMFKISIIQWNTTIVSIAAGFFKKAVNTIAVLG